MNMPGTPASTSYAQSETITVSTGEQCPETGWWQALQSENQANAASSLFLGRGCVMPAVGGAAVVWMQLRHAHLQTDY